MATCDTPISAASPAVYQRIYPYLLIVVAFLILSVATRSRFLNDTVFYAADIRSSQSCISLSRCPQIWDAAHLLWRPLGHVLLQPLLPLLHRAVGDNTTMATTLLLVILSWLASLIATLFLYAILFEETGDVTTSLLSCAVFLCANINLYGLHSGTSYSAGLACVMAAVWCAQRGRLQRSRSYLIFAGVGEALAIAFWLPYLVAFPALLLWMLFNCPDRRPQATSVLILATLLTCAILFGLGAQFAGARTVPDLATWVISSGHGTRQTHNLIRSIWGLPRSFVDLGQSGVRMKQFILRDPYARVSLGQLFGEAAWKMFLFYLALASLGFLWLTNKGKNILGVLVAALAANLTLAVAFEGGSPERYLPLYPFFFLAAASCISMRQTPTVAKALVYLLFVLMAANVGSSLTNRIHAEQERATQRLAPLLPLPPNSILFTVGDDGIAYLRLNAPFHEINQADFETAGVYSPMGQNSIWRQRFAQKALSVWEHGGNVWITKRVWSEHPQKEWSWVEGDDPNVKWRDIFEFFGSFEHSQNPQPDGFALLARSARNQGRLELIANSTVN